MESGGCDVTQEDLSSRSERPLQSEGDYTSKDRDLQDTYPADQEENGQGCFSPPSTNDQEGKRERFETPSPRISTTHRDRSTPSTSVSRMNFVDENKTTLWIGDLERWEDEDYIYHFFDQFCPKSVVSVKIARDREQQRSLGYGFIDFASREIAEQILVSAPALKRPHGRRFKLTWARGKTRQPFNPAAQRPSQNIGPYASPNTVPQYAQDVNASQVLSRAARWCVELIKVPPFVTPLRIQELILRPLNLDGTTTIQTFNNDSLRLVFPSSSAFFALIGRYRDGQFAISGTTINYQVPPDVMDQWNRVYEQSVDSPNSQGSSSFVPTNGATSWGKRN